MVMLGTLCYVRHDGKTLMLHRNKKVNDPHEGRWNGLGGKIEYGETPEECVIREVYEESGLRISAPQLGGIAVFEQRDVQEIWYAYIFTATSFTGALRSSPEGTLHWIPDEALSSLNLWSSDRKFLPHLAAHRLFSAKFVHEKGRLIDHQVVLYPRCNLHA